MSGQKNSSDEKSEGSPNLAEEIDEVEEAGEESFPASDSPSISPRRDATKPKA